MSAIASSEPASSRLLEGARRALAASCSWTAVAGSAAVATAALAGTIGPDARWLDALGRIVVARGHVPRGIPFAAAPSADWPNVPVLAELVFHGLAAALGDRGLLLAQLAAVAAGLGVTARAMRRAGATDAGAALALVLLVPGGLLALAGIKAQLFSLALFPLLVALIRADALRPSRRIWLLAPLVALWSNLHGAVLVGLGVALVYLVLGRMRRRAAESLAIAAVSLLAVCATPALWRTPQYYAGVMRSEASRTGYGLWAPLSLHSGFDVLLAAAALLLLVGFLRARPPLWEVVAAVLLAAETVNAARNGIWLLLFVVVRAAAAVRARRRPHPALAQGLAAVLAAVVAFALVRGPLTPSASHAVVERAIAAAHGSAILAEPASAEAIAAAGGRVWISNPLDAFARSDQRAYLDWVRARRGPTGQRFVLVTAGGRLDRELAADPRFALLLGDRTARLYRRLPRS